MKKTLGIIAPKMDHWDFDVIVESVREFKPQVKEASVRSALARLVRDEVLSVEGFRSGRRWTYIEQETELEQEAKPQEVETSPPADEPEPRKLDQKVIISELQRHLLNAVDQHVDGVPPQVLVVIMDTVGATEEQFQTAVEQLVLDGAIEEGKSLDDGGGHGFADEGVRVFRIDNELLDILRVLNVRTAPPIVQV